MSSTQDTITIKNADGSTLTVRVADITDSVLKAEIEQLEANPRITVHGAIIKKKLT